MQALVVDDDVTCRSFARLLLEKRGFTVHEAKDGTEAFDVLRRVGEVNLLIVDWHMEPMNGYSFIRCYRDSHPGSQAPIILLTAETGPVHHRIAAQAGAAACMTKPISPTSFMDAVAQCLPVFISNAAQPPPMVANRLMDEVGAEAWKELAEEFLQQAETFVGQIEGAIGRSEFQLAARIAHKLAGSSAMFELEDLNVVCRTLEKCALANDVEKTAVTFRELVSTAVIAKQSVTDQIRKVVL